MSDESLFEGMTIERGEAMPKRMVAGRESIPNPFVDAVHDSYAESLDPQVGADKAVRAIWVPVKPAECTVRELKRKDKEGNVHPVQWQAHPNITTALYLIRQAAIKHDLGVRIVVDYDGDHNLIVQSGGAHKGRVRVRFLGQKKKSKKGANTTTADTGQAA